MKFNVTFKTNDKQFKAEFGENVTVIASDKAFETVLDEIIAEQESIIEIQNKYMGGGVD